MKRLLLSAIACVAFAGTANAQLSPGASQELSDSIFCAIMAGLYVNGEVNKNPGLTEKEQELMRKSYAKGCIEGRNAARQDNLEIKEETISKLS